MSKDTKLVATELPSRGELVKEIASQEPGYQNYLDTLPDEKKLRIQHSVNAMRTGLHTVAPMMCMGASKCIFVEFCPIPERKADGTIIKGPDSDYPQGRQCILEKFYMQQKIIEYIEHLDVNPENPVEIAIVNELALIDLHKNRALMILSKGDRDGQGRDFMRLDITGYSENGMPSVNSKIHPTAEMIERLEKRREKWLDKLMQTRKAKADWAAKMGHTNTDSKILGEIQALRQALTQMDTKLITDEEEILLGD